MKGIFGWPAIQTRDKNKEESPEQDNIYIDIGCKSREEVLNKGIRAGNVITYDDQFFIMNNNKFVGRALDNRIGGFMIAQVARLLNQCCAGGSGNPRRGHDRTAAKTRRSHCNRCNPRYHNPKD